MTCHICRKFFPGFYRLILMLTQDESQRLPHLLSFHNSIQKPMLQQKLGTLKSFRQFLSNGLFNYPWSCKPNQGIGLCQNDITQHGKTGSHASRGGIRQHTDIQKSGITVAFQSRRRLCHLHQRDDPLLHTGTAGTGK